MRSKFAKVSDPHQFVTEAGERYRIIYDSKVLPDGSIDVVPVGKEDFQEFIKSFASECDISYIIKQLQLGNTSVVRQTEPVYGDFTKVPKTMAEALQIQIDAKRAWDAMPVDRRASFDYDFNKWLVNAGTDDWNIKMGFAEASGSSEENVGKESAT